MLTKEAGDAYQLSILMPEHISSGNALKAIDGKQYQIVLKGEVGVKYAVQKKLQKKDDNRVK